MTHSKMTNLDAKTLKEITLIALNNLSIGYSKEVIVEDLNLTFGSNQIICLLGANGCGKTTLLKTILGIVAPKRGNIVIQGREHSQWSRAELSKTIAYVPQIQTHFFAFSVEEMVLMGRTTHIHWRSTPKKRDKLIALDSLDRLGIAHLKDKTYTELSGGQRQLVLIARALAQEPTLLVMDEPTASLDYGNQLRVLEEIKKLKDTGLTILMTTHQPEHSLMVADRLLMIHNGRILADGLPADILTIGHLAEIYGLSEAALTENFNFLARTMTQA